MILKNFSNFSLNENDDSYIQSLLDKIQKLEDENEDLKNEIQNLENEIEDIEINKDDEIDTLNDKLGDLREEIIRFQKEIKRYEDLEEDWEQEKNDLENVISIYEDPESTFKSNSSYDKETIVDVFPKILSLMESYPIEFGSLIREKNLVTFKRLYYYYLNNEWLNAYTGKGASALNKFGVED